MIRYSWIPDQANRSCDAQTDDVIDEIDSIAYTELIKENTGYDAMQVSLPLPTLETFQRTRSTRL